MTMDITHNKKIVIKKLYDKKEFIKSVQIIERACQVSFFNSSHWFEALLATSPNLALYLFTCEDIIVGACCLNFKKNYKAGFCWQSLYLNRLGEPLQDQVWVECNNVISKPEYQTGVWQALLTFFCDSRAEELMVGMSYRLPYLENQSDYTVNKLMSSASYERTLKQAFCEQAILLSAFSRNTRSQLKRALKEANQLGGLTIEHAKNKQQAIDFFYEAGEFHKLRWHDSGYLNSYFVNFHCHLINSAFEKKQIDMVKIYCGQTVLAIYYYFLRNGRVYFYLGAVNYNVGGAKLKPGLLSHFFMMQKYACLGYDTYDWLAGDAQYKKSLADKVTCQHMYSLTKNNFKQRLISKLRYIKSAFIK